MTVASVADRVRGARDAAIAAALVTYRECNEKLHESRLGYADTAEADHTDRELAAIHRGEAPGSGEGIARLARNVGYFHLAMLVVIAIGLVVRG